ncbi:MAG: FAD-binding oxidoreductase [Betaproteobacteria bacterium]|nr:FAD-binding oxidoreductase [Betaproteobacteria bacterium]
MDYVIVGNGIVANTIAFRLTRKITPQDTLTIIGRTARPGSATLAAGAMLNSFAEIDAHSLQSDTDLYHFELSHLATRMWPTFERELIDAAGEYLPSGCAKCEIQSGGGCFGLGTYIINNTAADDSDDNNFDAIVTALKNFNEQFDFVNPRDIPNYFPAQKSRATRALYIHNEGWLNPRLVMEKLDAILTNHPRVKVRDATAERFFKSGSRVSTVQLDSGEMIEGDIFLLACGASVSKVLVKSMLEIDVQPVFYGTGVSLEIMSEEFPHRNCVRTPNRGGACGIYSVPYFWDPGTNNNHILIGASNFISPTPVNFGRLGSIEHLMKSAIEEINGNFYKAELIRTNVGWRPTTQDTFPLLGKTSIDNFIIASGTKRDGFHLSPVISDYITRILLNEPVDERFKCFAPERPLIRSLSREAAVEIIVSGLMSEQYQHGYLPSNIRMNAQVRETYRQDIEKLHDRIGATDWGIPPEMVNMYRNGHAH